MRFGSTVEMTNDLGLAFSPVLLDVSSATRELQVVSHVVHVPKATDNVSDGVVRYRWVVSGHEERESFFDPTSGLLLDGHDVEVVPELPAVSDDLELGRKQIPNSCDAKAFDLNHGFEYVLGVSQEELDSRIIEDPVQCVLLQGHRHEIADMVQSVSEGIEVLGRLEEEIEVPAQPVAEVDGDGRPAHQICARGDESAMRSHARRVAGDSTLASV